MLNFDQAGAAMLIVSFLIELTLAVRNRNKKQEVRDMMANFLIGIVHLFLGLFMKTVALSFHTMVYAHTLFKQPLTAWLWLEGLLLCDFVLYAYHYLGHRTRLFWASHVTHHSSLHYNISVGFRVNFVHLLYRFLFWSPLCLLGIPPWMILFFESVTTLQNVLVHTERVGKLGFLDLIFNTPSNHRVHHGSNEKYLDKNMGGILIIYDHLFGTYERETEKPIYGITHNIHTHNPATIILHEYEALLHDVPKIKGWKNKLRYLFGAPGSAPELPIINKLSSPISGPEPMPA
jgi:sterol desaturase/sphingolipid hydroxylase (fatty acid hydroxylase superfamily)